MFIMHNTINLKHVWTKNIFTYHIVMEPLKAEELVNRALFGVDDQENRQRFIMHFGEEVRQFEATIASIYIQWREFEQNYSGNLDADIVIVTVFLILARLVHAMKLLMTGHVTLAGVARRMVIEAIALAILFSKHGMPYLNEYKEDKFSVNKAIGKIIKHHKKLNINKKALEKMEAIRDSYNKLSHATITSMIDIIDKDGIYLGPQFNENNLSIFNNEISSCLSLSNFLTDIVSGITSNMREWPCYYRKD